jgi:hypothetical protein
MSVLLYYVDAAPPSAYEQTRSVIIVPQCGMLQHKPVPLVMTSAHVCGSGVLGHGGGILPVNQTLGVRNDNDDPYDKYLKDRQDPSIRVERLTLKNQNSTVEQCIQFVNLVQKIHRSTPGIYITSMSIDVYCGYKTIKRIEKLAQLNKDSEWLNGNEYGRKTAACQYDINECKLKTALKNFQTNKEPVRDELINILQWFMDFFDHRHEEKWQDEPVQVAYVMEDEITYWRRYFHVLKNLALGFEISPAYFEFFCT